MRPEDRRWDMLLTVGLVLLWVANLTFRYYQSPPHLPLIPADACYYKMMMDSILEDGDIDIINQLNDDGRKAVTYGVDGSFYPKHPPLFALAALPFYALFGPSGFAAFVLLVMLGIGVLVYRLAALFVGSTAAYRTTLVFMSLPLSLKYAYRFDHDALGALIVLLGVYLLLTGRLFAAGACLGLALWQRVTNGVILPFAAACLLLEGGGRRLPWLVLGTVFGALPMLTVNWLSFGAPWVFPYERTVHFTDFARRRFYWGPGASSLFTAEVFWENLAGQLWGRIHGFLTTALQSLIGLPGLAPLARVRPGVAVLVAGTLVSYVLVFCVYKAWPASHYGNRFVMPAVYLLAIPAAFVVERLPAMLGRFWFRVVFAVLTIGLLLAQMAYNHKAFTI